MNILQRPSKLPRCLAVPSLSLSLSSFLPFRVHKGYINVYSPTLQRFCIFCCEGEGGATVRQGGLVFYPLSRSSFFFILVLEFAFCLPSFSRAQLTTPTRRSLREADVHTVMYVPKPTCHSTAKYLHRAPTLPRPSSHFHIIPS